MGCTTHGVLAWFISAQCPVANRRCDVEKEYKIGFVSIKRDFIHDHYDGTSSTITL